MAAATPKTKDGQMKMSQLAQASGLTVSTIKFYISQGLLPRPTKAKPNVAYYDDAFLRRLLIIKRMRSEGLSIKSMKSILDKYPFQKVSEWEDFKKQAKGKDQFQLEEVERLATLSGEERRTEAILDAAFAVFSRVGYHNATVDDIAQQAGVSKGTCYQYFAGKEEIFLATVDRTAERLMTEAEVASAGAKDALARLGLAGLTVISNFHDLQFMFISMLTEILGGNERMKQKAKEMQDKVTAFLARDIELGIKQKMFRQVDADTVATTFMGIAGAVGQRALIDPNFDVLTFFVNLMEFLQHGLAAEQK